MSRSTLDTGWTNSHENEPHNGITSKPVVRRVVYPGPEQGFKPCICADPEHCRKPIPGRACKRRIGGRG